jgi:segregation and condensation protein B
MQAEDLNKTIETLLFITDRPLSASQLAKLTGADADAVGAAIEAVKASLAERGSALQVMEVADGFQFGTKQEFAPFVRKLFAERMTMRLSTASLETLSIVAYKQPLTRAEVEEIRGVEVIAALETLLEKRLVKVVGRKETVGRPLMYGTTMEFLRHFGLKSLEELPPIETFAAQAEEAIQGPVKHGPFVPNDAPAAEASAETPAPAAEAVPAAPNEDPSSGQ